MLNKSQINSKLKKFRLLLICSLVIIWNLGYLYAQELKEEPIIVNGDVVEYSMDNKEVTATGNISVTYKGAKLTCQKLTVNTQTKDAEAEGNARLDDEKGVIEGAKIRYNFEAKTGMIIDSEFRSNPYFGKAEQVEKVSDTEFIASGGYITTCSYDKPHYRMKSRKVDFFPGDKVKIKDSVFCLGQAPLLYLPRYNHSLKDPLMHVQLMPGNKKDWGAYLLSAWRYSLTENIKGRIYLDYRYKLGLAEGFGTNYTTHRFGKGDFKYYYTQERPRSLPEGTPAEFQRYLIRWRHKWDIDERTNLTSEYYKISDEKRKLLDPQSNMLKDFFFREYEKDSQPLTYTLFHHSFQHSSIDLLIQKRTNHWYDQLDKLPEAKYNLPSLKMGESPFYFEHNSSLANFNKKATTSPVTPDEVSVTRLDTTHKVSLPMKLAFIQLAPFVKNQETFYDKDVDGSSIAPRTIFYTGIDASTKFYRLLNVKSNVLGMDINGLRHIITPTIGYAYNHEPTIASSELKQIDTIDSIAQSNAASLELSNKLQTKRKGASVDLLDFRVNTSYVFKPQTGDKLGSNLSDILFDFKLLPYSWLRIDADATYKHSGLRSDTNYNRFINANYDINFDLGKERYLGVGQRYQRKGGNEITYNFNWRLNPKWRFSLYERFNRGHDPTLKRGLREQEYTISRDLHCWFMDITYNVKGEEGETIWFIFRLKAFPELEFGFNQSYHAPKSGSQSNP